MSRFTTVPIIRQGEDKFETVLVSSSDQLVKSLQATSPFVDSSFSISQNLELLETQRE